MLDRRENTGAYRATNNGLYSELLEINNNSLVHIARGPRAKLFTTTSDKLRIWTAKRGIGWLLVRRNAMGQPDGGGVGFVQSVIDWKCKPESVQRPWGGSTEGE